MREKTPTLPLRILQIVHSFPPYNLAGTEIYTYNLAEELAKKHRVFIFHRVNNSQISEFTISYNRHKNLDVYAINNTFRKCSSFEEIYENKIINDNFAKILNDINPDIVHIQHLLFLSAGIIEEVKKKNIPVVFTLNDYWLICPQSQLIKNNLETCQKNTALDCIHCVKYQLSIKKKILNIYHFLHGKVPVFLIAMLKSIYFACARISLLSRKEEVRQINLRNKRLSQISSMVDIFLSPSVFLRKKFIEFGIPDNKILIFRYGLNTKFFKKFQETKAEVIRFGFIGTLLPSKGVAILIRAFKKIKAGNIELKVYGRQASYRGFENYLRYIKKLAKGKSIRFMGGYNNEDIAEILSGLDVLVVPSIWYENYPLVIQEALLAKVLLIASRIGGIPELIDDNINGLLFEPGDSEELQEKMQYVIENPDFFKKVRENIPTVENIESHAEKMERLYKTLLFKKSE